MRKSKINHLSRIFAFVYRAALHPVDGSPIGAFTYSDPISQEFCEAAYGSSAVASMKQRGIEGTGYHASPRFRYTASRLRFNNRWQFG